MLRVGIEVRFETPTLHKDYRSNNYNLDKLTFYPEGNEDTGKWFEIECDYSKNGESHTIKFDLKRV